MKPELSTRKAIGITMVALLVTSLFAFAPTTKPAYAPHAFDTAINLSNNTNESLWSQVAASGNSAYVVWQDFGRVFFRRSTDSGGTFGSTLDLGAVSGSKNVQVAASGNSAYVAWSNSSGVFFRRSIDNGGNFDATINLGCCHFGFEVGLAASGSSVYVAWHDGGEVYLRASTDNGAGFGITINVSNTPSGGTDSMRIAASGNSVYAAWSDSTIGNRDIFFNRSTDNGATFGTATNLSNTPGRSGCCGSTGIAASGNSVYVRWDEEDAGRVFFRASTDSGATFGGVIDVGDASGTSFRLMAASGSNVYLVFLDDTLGNVEVFFRRSTDSGGSFDSPLNLSNNSGGSGAQAVDASGSTVYVIWVDVTSGNQVLVRGSTDSGATFANAVTFNLTANPFTPFQARIAVAGRAYAVWDDTLTPFNQDIFFSRSASHNPPVANAGPDQTVNEEKFVTLDGRGSFDPDGDPMTFSWTQTAGPTVTLVNPNTARPAFNAPLVNTQTILTFQLVVNDGTSNSIPDTVNITVNPVFNFITGRFNKSTAPAPASQTISGLGFQPKALILFSDGSAVNGIQEHYNFAIGFSDGTNSRSLVLHSDDNSILSQAGRAGGTRVLRLLSNGNPTVSAEATLTSFNADGFTLNWVTNDASATKIHYIALGGSNLTNVRVNHFLANTVAGNQNVTGIGFQPDFLMFINPRTTNAGNWQAVHAFAGLGFAKSATEEGAIAVLSEDLSDPMDTYRWQKADRSILTLTPSSGAIEAEAELVSMISDGFRINWIDPPPSAHRIYYLALKGGDYDVGTFDQRTSPGTQIISTVGFKPKGLLVTTIGEAMNPFVLTNNRIALGAAHATGTGNQGTIWAGDKDAVPTSVAVRSTVTTRTIRTLIETDVASLSPITGSAELQSFDADGFTLNWSTADGVPREHIYVAFSKPADRDSDGLRDLWESNGIDFNSDGVIDLNLPALGANKLHKDIFVEADYMQFHQPNATGINNVITAFANAPVSNPDGTNGINLHVLVDDQIPHQDTTSIPDGSLGGDFQILKTQWFGTLAERQSTNSANILAAKRLVYHYNLWIHNQAERIGVSGIAELPGNDFVVSLGEFDQVNGHGVGSLDQQQGTFMHELGHNLNLFHGGNEPFENCKPNYLSLMSYSFQFSLVDLVRPLDYSRSVLLPLNENNLSEPAGVSASTPLGLSTVYGSTNDPTHRVAATGGVPIDWNRDGDTTDNGITQDINNIFEPFPGITGCPSSTTIVLNGYDDWSNLQLPFTSHANFADGASSAGATTGKPVVESDEFTSDLVKQIRLSYVRALDSAIKNIPAAAFSNPALAGSLKNDWHNTLLLDSNNNVASFMNSYDFQQIITKLREMRSEMDGTVGHNKADDLILVAKVQREILEKLDKVIALSEIGLSLKDTTAPVIQLVTPLDGAVYLLNQNVIAEYYVFDDRTAYPVVVATAPSGSYIDTSTTGTKTFSVTAVDRAGNSVTRTVIYQVTQ